MFLVKVAYSEMKGKHYQAARNLVSKASGVCKVFCSVSSLKRPLNDWKKTQVHKQAIILKVAEILKVQNPKFIILYFFINSVVMK